MIRPARPGDAAAILALHWGNWRRHYREVLPAEYIDGPLGDDLAAQWRERFQKEPAPTLILVHEGAAGIDGFVAGFAEAGTLYIDNLHTAVSGRGIGTALLRAVARQALAEGLESAHLFVFDVNVAAMGFYESLGAVRTLRQTEKVFGVYPAAETRFDWARLESLAAG